MLVMYDAAPKSEIHFTGLRVANAVKLTCKTAGTAINVLQANFTVEDCTMDILAYVKNYCDNTRVCGHVWRQGDAWHSTAEIKPCSGEGQKKLSVGYECVEADPETIKVLPSPPAPAPVKSLEVSIVEPPAEPTTPEPTTPPTYTTKHMTGYVLSENLKLSCAHGEVISVVTATYVLNDCMANMNFHIRQFCNGAQLCKNYWPSTWPKGSFKNPCALIRGDPTLAVDYQCVPASKATGPYVPAYVPESTSAAAPEATGSDLPDYIPNSKSAAAYKYKLRKMAHASEKRKIWDP